jgi:methylmalonyl-CoA mutase
MEILEVDNQKVRDWQISRLKKIKAGRDNQKVQILLKRVSEAAENDNINLLEIAIEAARERVTVGEISLAMEKVFGRYKPMTKVVSGIYKSGFSDKKRIEEIINESGRFAKLKGRRPRILIAKLGQDGHDRGAKVIASAFADLGFDVDMGSLFSTAEETARQAVENDVHIIGISSLAGGHKTLIPQLIECLKQSGRSDILVAAGGVIPKKDYKFLIEKGAVAVFGPGTNIITAAQELLTRMLK